MLGFAAEGWMNFREGPQRPSLMLLCRDPGLKPSCQVRTTMSETAGWLQVQWSIVQKHEKLRRSAISGRFWSRRCLKKHGCLSCWAGEEYYVIMMHYSRWKLFYLHQWSQSVLEEQTLPVHIKGFCAFSDDSEILKYSDPCSQPPGGKQEHLASVPCLQSPLFSCKN